MAQRKNLNLLVIAARLLAADAVRALVPAPGVGFRLRIFSISWSIRVAAAQIVDIGEAAGAVGTQIAAIPASSAQPGSVYVDTGFPLTENTALSADPIAAGPEVQFIVEYLIEPKTSATA